VGRDPVGRDPVGRDPVGRDQVGREPVGRDQVGREGRIDPWGHVGAQHVVLVQDGLDSIQKLLVHRLYLSVASEREANRLSKREAARRLELQDVGAHVLDHIFIYSPLKQRGSMKAYQKFFLNGQLLRNCINSTALYYSTVSALGGDAFDNAQANCVCEGR